MTMLKIHLPQVLSLLKHSRKIPAMLLASLLFLSGQCFSDELRLGDTVPDFTADSTIGELRLYDWMGTDHYLVLFSHPKDFTPVCTTEIAEFVKRYPQFEKLNVKLLGLSIDSVDDHKLWTGEILKAAEAEGDTLPFPLNGDKDLKVAKLYNMLSNEEEARDDRTAVSNKTARSVFIIGPTRN